MRISMRLLLFLTCTLAFLPEAFAGDAPAWMHALVSAQLPTYDEKTEAVLLLSDTTLTVLSADKVRLHVREAYRILRPNGRKYGTVVVNYNTSRSKVSGLKAWCIPASGKDYEVKESAGADVALQGIEGSELVSDMRAKLLEIPAPEPGNVVGYEYDREERQIYLQHEWAFQQYVPVREARLTLQLLPGWEYKTGWLNHDAVAPAATGQWVLNDVPGLRTEAGMPPMHAVSGAMLLTLLPVGGAGANGFSDWKSMGTWYQQLTAGVREPSAEIKQRVAQLTAGKSSQLEQAKALADFVQHDIRYVAIELGIGGILPHHAGEIYRNHYGDCKDKVTLLSAMLHEAGIESFFVLVNHVRGAVGPATPVHDAFDHVIIAIRLPEGDLGWPSPSVLIHPTYGRLLYFDPTDEITPFGIIRGELQGNYGLLVGFQGGELLATPQLAPAFNSLERRGRFQLTADGVLRGKVEDSRTGDLGARERWHLRLVKDDTDRIKRVEAALADSLSNSEIRSASLINRNAPALPLIWKYEFVSAHYGKSAGPLLMFRPRVIGIKASSVLETKEPRKFDFEFEGLTSQTDTYEFTLPEGYVVDELPPPVDVEYSFGSYHARTVAEGATITYSRAFVVRELSVPLAKIPDLKRFYRIIAGDERNTVVLRLK